MSNLANMQKAFQDYLLENNPDFKSMIQDTQKISADQRMDIYYAAYYSRLVDALANNFPVLKIYLGEENFECMARHYVSHFPSSYRSIRWYGEKLADFLKTESDYQTYPYLAQLAEFEWAVTLAFDAEDSAVFTVEDMMQIPTTQWIDMRLHLQRALHRLNFSWNVVPIWQAISNENESPELTESKTAAPWIIWRTDYNILFCLLTDDEAWAIDALMRGLTFAELCTGLCAWVAEDKVGEHAASLLKGWIQSGLITHISFEGENHYA